MNFLLTTEINDHLQFLDDTNTCVIESVQSLRFHIRLDTDGYQE